MNNILKNISKENLNKDLRFIIHNLHNFGNITPDVYQAFDMFIEPKELLNIVKISKSYDKLPKTLFNYYKNWLSNVASKEQKEVCLYYGILNLTHQMLDKKDITKFNMIEEFQEQNTEEKELKLETIKVEKNIEEEINIGEVKTINLSDLNCDNDIVVHESLISSNSKNLFYDSPEDLKRRVNILYKLSTTENLQWLEQSNFLISQFNLLKTELNTVFDNYLIYTNKKMELSGLKNNITESLESNLIDNKTIVEKTFNINEDKVVKFGKKSIKKAIKLYKNLFNNNDMELFVSGSGFTLEGEKFNYSIKQSNQSIISHTINPVSAHIPYSLEVLNKDNIVLCNACILFKETPIIDQIIAFALHIQSGREEDFLKTANFFNKKPEYYRNEHFNETKNIEITKEELEYSNLNKILEGNMDKYFMEFFNIEDLPKNIKNFHLTWFDEMLENYELKKSVKKVEKKLDNALKNLGELNV